MAKRYLVTCAAVLWCGLGMAGPAMAQTQTREINVARAWEDAMKTFDSPNHTDSERLFTILIEALFPQAGALDVERRQVLVDSFAMRAQLRLERVAGDDAARDVEALVDLKPDYEVVSPYLGAQFRELLVQVQRQKTGRLDVTVDRQDAAIGIDGVARLTGGGRVVVAAGRRRVTARVPGLPPLELMVEVPPGGVAEVPLSFAAPPKASGRLLLDVTPTAAMSRIGERVLGYGSQDLSLDEGTYLIYVSADGWEPRAITVRIRPGDVTQTQVALRPKGPRQLPKRLTLRGSMTYVPWEQGFDSAVPLGAGAVLADYRIDTSEWTLHEEYGASLRLWGPLTVAVTRSASETSFFALTSATGLGTNNQLETGELSRSETATHFDLGVSGGDRVPMFLWVGMSTFKTRQVFVTDLAISGGRIRQAFGTSLSENSRLGLNAGLDLSVMIVPVLGLGVSGRVVYRDVTYTGLAGEPERLDTFGFVMSGGLRVRF